MKILIQFGIKLLFTNEIQHTKKSYRKRRNLGRNVKNSDKTLKN